jgi:C4-dicarboxylate-specific signal transduction histidine kinase
MHDYMVSSMADMRRGLKAYAMNIVHLGYSLRQPLFSQIDDVSHKEATITELLKNFRFLHSFDKVCVYLRNILLLTLEIIDSRRTRHRTSTRESSAHQHDC